MNDFWSVVGIAATVSSAAAAVVSTGLVLFFRYRDRPSVTWLVEPLNFQPNDAIRRLWRLTNRGDPAKSLTIANVGDGAAHQIQASGTGCTIMMFVTDKEDTRSYRTPATIARRSPTEHFGIFIWYDDVKAWSDSSIELTWLEVPTRHQKRRTEIIPIAATLRALEDKFNTAFGIPDRSEIGN
jgi:hypothetical protein